MRSRASLTLLACARITAMTALTMTLVASHVAHAEPSSPDSAHPGRRIVELQLAGGGAFAAAVKDTIRELLGRATLLVESQAVSRIDTESAPLRESSRVNLLARAFIDFRMRDSVHITVIDGRTGDVALTRSVPRDAPPAVVREALAHIVQAAIDPMQIVDREGAVAKSPELPVATEPPKSEATRPVHLAASHDDGVTPKPHASKAKLALDLSTIVGVGSYASGAGVIPRAGVAASLAYRGGIRPFASIAASYIFPFETGSDVALAHVAVTAMRGAFGLEIFGSSSFAIDVAAGAGVDVLSVGPRSNVLPAGRLHEATARGSPVAIGAVAGHIKAGSNGNLSLTLAMDLDLAWRHWVVESDRGVQSDVFVPSRVRPLALLGFTFAALGEARFAPLEVKR